MEVVVGRGLDHILFGISEAELISRLGSPDKVEIPDFFEEEAEEGERHLRYNGLRCCFWFRSDRLHWIRCANPELEIFGRRLLGERTDVVLPFLSSRLSDTLEYEDYGSFESHTFEDSWLELQFEYDVLHEVCFGHLWAADDEPVWPVA